MRPLQLLDGMATTGEREGGEWVRPLQLLDGMATTGERERERERERD